MSESEADKECGSEKKEIRVCVSGYMDPMTVGHLEYMRLAKQLGDKLVVIVNNDNQAVMKKGAPFMPAVERAKIVSAVRWVDEVVIAVDEDRTVCQTLRLVRPDKFCNGGDQNNQSIPEVEVCHELGIELVDGLGNKIQSSSWLIKDAIRRMYKPKMCDVGVQASAGADVSV